LTSIRTLDLGFNEITDAGLPHLTALKASLAELTLRNNTMITDEGVKYLAELTLLSVLDLRDTRLSNKGLMTCLLELTSLTRLLVGHTMITSEVLNEFRNKRPEVAVRW
jgi:Ran GTPase-activating protein (RanGAP) involved in mRNA processing and transport